MAYKYGATGSVAPAPGSYSPPLPFLPLVAPTYLLSRITIHSLAAASPFLGAAPSAPVFVCTLHLALLYVYPRGISSFQFIPAAVSSASRGSIRFLKLSITYAYTAARTRIVKGARVRVCAILYRGRRHYARSGGAIRSRHTRALILQNALMCFALNICVIRHRWGCHSSFTSCERIDRGIKSGGIRNENFVLE